MARHIRTISLRHQILIALLGVWMGVLNFFHPNDAAGQTAALSTLAGSSAGSGGETSFGSRGSVQFIPPGGPLGLTLLGLGLVFMATIRRRKFKGHHQTSRESLLRPVGTPAKPVSGLGECVWIDLPAADPQPPGGLPQTFDSFDPCIACAARLTGPHGGMADSDQSVRCRMPH